MGNSTELRYLESEAVLKERIHQLSGRRPSATQAAYVASCLLHGRLYWESADSAPIETRPLLLYYGAASFAKALIMGKTCCRIGDIATSHGVSCVAGLGELVGTFGVRTNGSGLFQQFNDQVAGLSRVHYFEANNSRYHSVPATPSAGLTTLATTLEDLLARVPEIAETFALCCGRPASVLRFHFQAPFFDGSPHTIRVDLPETFQGLNGLRTHVNSIRTRAPFLQQWAVFRAEHSWNNSITQFSNHTILGQDEFALLVEEDQGKTFGIDQGAAAGWTQFDALQSLPHLAGGFGGLPAYVSDLDEAHLSEYSVLLLGLLALSSLVRYHPHVWTSCVHRRRFGERAIDDQFLPAIEAFLRRATEAFPALVADVLLQR